METIERGETTGTQEMGDLDALKKERQREFQALPKSFVLYVPPWRLQNINVPSAVPPTVVFNAAETTRRLDAVTEKMPQQQKENQRLLRM